jgi:hypothetical protein
VALNNQIKHELAESELFQYFDVYSNCFIAFEWFNMMYLTDLNDFHESGIIAIEVFRLGSIYEENFWVSL